MSGLVYVTPGTKEGSSVEIQGKLLDCSVEASEIRD